MHYKISWHKKEVAELWPKGSVVLCRKAQARPLHHTYSYILSLCFTPEAISFDKGYEYLLIEEPKGK
jgi:hypothetical protein